MKEYVIDYLPLAEEGIIKLKKAGDKQSLKKLQKLIEELKVHPTFGTGHPEQLKHFDGNVWSRHITDKHRLKYEIFEEISMVEILQMRSSKNSCVTP